jgi:hypothetical protein
MIKKKIEFHNARTNKNPCVFSFGLVQPSSTNESEKLRGKNTDKNTDPQKTVIEFIPIALNGPPPQYFLISTMTYKVDKVNNPKQH